MMQSSHNALLRRVRTSVVAVLSAIIVVAPSITGVAVASPAAAATTDFVAVSTVASSADRIAGSDRYATAVMVSGEAFAPGVQRVFLASGTDYPDALSAAPIAAALAAPLLLTARDAVPAVVIAELERLAPIEGVVIAGGAAVVSAAVVDQLEAEGFAVERVFGANRYATSRALIERFAAPSDTLYVATGRNYPDALAAAAAAGSIAAPVLLVDGSSASLDVDSVAMIGARSVNAVAIAGGTGVVSADIEQQLRRLVPSVVRLAGTDRFGTAVAINTHAFPAAERAFIATGAGFADALAGAVYAGQVGAPLYSSSPTCLPAATRVDVMERLQVSTVTLLGGAAVLGPRVQALEACTPLDDQRAASEARLASAVMQRLASLPGTYSVSVRELGGVQASVSIRGATVQEPMSVMKVFAAYALLSRFDSGQLTTSSLTRSGETAGDCLRAMITVSDNFCHHDLVALMGAGSITAQLQAEGYLGTGYYGGPSGTTPYTYKATTTDDLALLLSRLQRGELLSAPSTAQLMTLLETQLWRAKIPSGVEAGVPVANKTGSAPGPTGWYHSDAGIVSAPTGAYVLTVLGSGGATAEGVREISRVVYQQLTGRMGASGSFGSVNLVTVRPLTYYRNADASVPLGTMPAGTALAMTTSVRTWWRVIYNGVGVYVPASGVRALTAYPRSFSSPDWPL